MTKKNPPEKPRSHHAEKSYVKSHVEKLKDRIFSRKGHHNIYIDRPSQGSTVEVVCYSQDTLVGEITRKYSNAAEVRTINSVYGPETRISIKPDVITGAINPRRHDSHDREALEKKWTEAKNNVILELTKLIEKHGYKLNKEQGHEAEGPGIERH